jgi:hypothetical protein
MFRYLSTFNFAIVNQCSWELVIMWIEIFKWYRDCLKTDFAATSIIKIFWMMTWRDSVDHIFEHMLNIYSLFYRWSKCRRCERVTRSIFKCRRELIKCKALTSNEQYHWVFEFASSQHQKVLSYLTNKCSLQIDEQNLIIEKSSDWLTIISWQTVNASDIYIIDILIQFSIALNRSSYTF